MKYKNKFTIKDTFIIIHINSKKLGPIDVYIDRIDEFLLQYKWYIKINEKGYIKANAVINGKDTTMAIAIMGKRKGFMIDHIDRNPFNNRRNNLRFVTNSVNNKNRVFINNKSGFTGVVDKGDRYITTWYNKQGVRKSKTFSKKKYGENHALEKAIRKRYREGLKNDYNFTIEQIKMVKPNKIKIRRL